MLPMPRPFLQAGALRALPAVLAELGVVRPLLVSDGTDVAARREVMLGAFAGAIGKGQKPAHAIAISGGEQGLHHGMLSALGLAACVDAMAVHVPERMARVDDAMDAAGG